MRKTVYIGTICIVGLLITFSATAMVITGPDERNNRFLPEPVVNVMKVEGTPVSEALDVTGIKECKPNIKIRSTDIQVTDSEDDEYTPAIAVEEGGDLFLSYTSKESILVSSIIWTFSTDDGETWNPGVFFDIDGTESHPAVDYLGNEKKFTGTILGPPGESDGALQYLFRCDNLTDTETYELTYWDWAASYPYRDRRIPDVGGYLLDEVSWFYGIMACAGTRDVRVDMPMFNYMNYEDEGQGWSSYWDQYQGCENVAVEVDQTNGYFYAVFDYLNETVGNWDLLVLRGDCHNDGTGHPIWFDSLLIGGEENTKYPAVGVREDQVIILAQSDAAGTQDIVCYYSSDAGDNWDMSVVANDAGNDEVYPAIISNGLSAICTFVMNGDLYVSSTYDGGATWEDPVKMNDESGTVVEEYRTASLCLGFGTWSDERNDNADIFFDNAGTPPEKPAKPDGPISGATNTEHTYSTSATDPGGDQIYYVFDWDDGTESEAGPYNSGETGSASHTWTEKGNYNIKVKARNTIGLESDWSDPLAVSMPKTKQVTYPLLQKFLEIFLNAFSLL